MDAIQLAHAVLLGIVEGATEFIPVSSTGHLIVVEALLGWCDARAETFAIFIQLGAVAAVAWDRRATLRGRLLPAPRLAGLILVALAPAAILGLLLHRLIKHYLFAADVVACGLIVGALAILIIESREPVARIADLEGIGWRDALAVGLAQCAAFVPGVSRSAASILGAMLLGWRRPIATEFSFLLAIPTIGGAAALDLFRSRHLLGAADLPLFTTGTVVSFVVSLVSVRWLLAWVRNHDFRPFAYWRLLVGLSILLFGLGRCP